MNGIGPTRLYAAAIAVVSGVYSVTSALGMTTTLMDGMGGGRMGALAVGDWIMLAIGLVVLVHGVILLTPAAEMLGRLSGPLMVLWSVIMLANQGLAATGVEGMSMIEMGIDFGMISLAVLMLASGLIMIARPMGGERAG